LTEETTMQTMDVPCDRCDEFRARFEAAGYRVHACEAHATKAGMCVLRYAWPDAAAVVAAAAAGAERLTAAAPAAPAAPAATLTPTQAATARAIVNIFETSSVLGDYGRVTLLPNDSGRLTYGRSQTTLGSGNLAELLRRYCSNPGARFRARLLPLLPRFEQQAVSLDHDTAVHNLLRACADDRVMRETQDAFFDDAYWQPALRAAKKLGLGSPLAIAVVYDSHIHGSWVTLRKATVDAVGAPAQAGEQTWIAAYVRQRRDWLAHNGNPTLRSTVYRMAAFQRLIDQGLWGLPLPLVVRDVEISHTTLNATPQGCYDGPQPGTRQLALSDPLLRGLDVRLVQLGLSDRGMDILADGVFGSTSSQRIAEYQIATGRAATGVADLALIGELAA
jgi:chitosanase